MTVTTNSVARPRKVVSSSGAELHDVRLSSFFRRLLLYLRILLSVRPPHLVFLNQLRWLRGAAITLQVRRGRFRCRANSKDANEVVILHLTDEYPESLLREIPHDAFVVDAGAHIGTFTVMLALKRPDVRILAIEPDDENFRLLLTNADLNAISGPALLTANVALAAENGERLLNRGEDTDTYHLIPRSSAQSAADVKVKAETLSSLLERHGIRDPWLLKLDIEGGEYEVLQDGETVRSFSRIVMEWHTAQWPGGFGDKSWIMSRLCELGFRAYDHKENVIVAVREASPDTTPENRVAARFFTH